MESFLDHITINISNPKLSLPFYKDLLLYFDYRIIRDDEHHIAGRKAGSPDFWVKATEEKYLANKFYRKNIGINHFAFHVPRKEDVDRFCKEFLQERGIKTLYSSPKSFPKYTKDYYAVYFEDPDRIKLEVCAFSFE
jgi:catechol 2,3-dioxygenase-like lactoylglutathione lyase family enzyme